MRPTTTEDVLELLDGCFLSAALGAAMELGLFRLLEQQPLAAPEVAVRLGIPTGRCHYWLQMLQQAGLLEAAGDRFTVSATGREVILGAYSHESWAFLAREVRERMPLIQNLPRDLREAGSVWEALGLVRPNYLAQLRASEERAREFTRTLYELHLPLAAALAEELDLRDATRMLDLGGGSGVVSEALLRRYDQLEAVVIDLPNVCAVGREIAAEHGLSDRLTYLEADYLRDKLPSGFDFVLLCDASGYGASQLQRVRATLRPGGQLAIVEQLSPASGIAPPGGLVWAFQGSLEHEGAGLPTAAAITQGLEAAGYELKATRRLDAANPDTPRFSRDWTLIEARRPLR